MILGDSLLVMTSLAEDFLVMTPTDAVELPALALEGFDQFFGLDGGEPLAHPVRTATCSRRA